MTGNGAVLVTGGTSGIGLGIARRLVQSGRTVVISGRDPGRSQEAAAALRATRTDANAIGVPADVRDESQMAGLVAHAVDRFGSVTGLVTAAGRLARGSVLQLPAQEFEAVWRTNVAGTWHAIRACLPHMLETGLGRIVTVGSVLGTVGAPERAGYAATKGAIDAMTRSIALELADTGVTVNCVAPGPIRTASPARDRATARFDSGIPVGRWGTPADVAQMVLPLLDVSSGWTTGTIIHVDGGYTAQ